MGSALCALSWGTAWGQTTAPETSGGAETPDSGEIVVTANKRTQALNDVGLTVSVLSGDDLAARKITSLADIALTVPGLSYSASENNTPVFTLRGIGFNEAALAAYPTVSVYTDEAPLAFPVLAGQGAFDLERIEILKGPQGTLFGQNSTGGAINYIAAKPTGSFAAGADVSYGRFDTVEVNGHISGPLSDTLKARIAGHFIRGDDWQQSYTRNDSLGRTLAYAGRATFDWEPSGGTQFRLTLNAWRDKSDPQAGQLVAVVPQGPASIPDTTGYPYPPRTPRAADWSFGQTVGTTGLILDPRPASNRRLLQATLRGDVDLGSDVTLTSLTSYVDFRQRQRQDYDGISLNDNDILMNNGKIRSFFQELRLANDDRSAVRWIVGANYQDSRINESNAVSYTDSVFGVPSFSDIAGNGYRSDTIRRDYAAFGNIEYDIQDALTLKLGARYTKNVTKAEICNYDLGDGKINELFRNVAILLSGNPDIPPIGPDGCFSLDANFIPGIYRDKLDEDNVSWRAGLDYKVRQNFLLYANISRGYKAGSYPTVSASRQQQYFPVTQERVTAYEAGLKFTSVDRIFNLNMAGFYYDYSNKQVRGKFYDPIFAILSALVNVPKSRLYGLEIEGGVKPVEGLSINGSVTYLNSKITEYTGLNGFGIAQDFRGARIPFTPKWQGQINLDYNWQASSTVKPFFGATLNARTGTAAYPDGENVTLPNVPGASTAPGVVHPFEIRGYATVDLRAGADIGDHARVMVWGKNVTNEYYWQNVIYSLDTGFRLAARPATYGVTLSWKY
jgi:outer membrane receptor protein involved in Fe transport